MREIKFRGQRTDNGEMVYGFLYQLPLPTGVGSMILTTDNTNEDNSVEPEYHLAFTLWVDLFPVDPATVGQYTGLKDKNGKEIYEGDVVVVTNLRVNGFGKQMLASIVYDEELACFDFKALDRQRCICNSALETELEVIGNIYDNPELLEKE